jgi:hypothetical protein
MNPNTITAFKSMSDGNERISYEQFKGKFGEPLSTALWGHLHGDRSSSKEISLQEFSAHCKSLMGMSTDVYIKMLMPARNLLAVCFQCGEAQVQPTDKPFIDSIVDDMGGGESLDSVLAWKNSTCPRLCQSVQQRVFEVFLQSPPKQESLPHSEILSPVQMFILQRCLPTTVYFPKNSSSSEGENSGEWIRLYSSAEQGISINRFETNAMDYRGSTICIFKMTGGDISVIAADQEWRHGLKKFGGPHTILFRLYPKFERIDSGDAPPLYCNFKNRSEAFGISFGRHFSVDGEFSNVSEVEVWACSGEEALQEQKKQKLWQKRQAQKHAVVPRNWDDNPDKCIMEMAGYTFSTERRDQRPPDER